MHLSFSLSNCLFLAIFPSLNVYPLPSLTDGVAQVVKHLPSKRKALSSNPMTAKKKKKNSPQKPFPHSSG
jgi:hypothetical protein